MGYQPRRTAYRGITERHKYAAGSRPGRTELCKPFNIRHDTTECEGVPAGF